MTLLSKLYLCHRKYFDICGGQASESLSKDFCHVFLLIIIFLTHHSSSHISILLFSHCLHKVTACSEVRGSLLSFQVFIRD